MCYIIRIRILSIADECRRRTATHTEYRMVELNLTQRVYHAIKKHLTSSIDEWPVNVRHIL